MKKSEYQLDHGADKAKRNHKAVLHFPEIALVIIFKLKPKIFKIFF